MTSRTAFPVPGLDHGLTMREHFALEIFKALVSDTNSTLQDVKTSVELADKLIEELKK